MYNIVQSNVCSFKRWAPIPLIWNFSIYPWRLECMRFFLNNPDCLLVGLTMESWANSLIPDMELITFLSCVQSNGGSRITFLSCVQSNGGSHIYWNEIFGYAIGGGDIHFQWFGLSLCVLHNGFRKTCKFTYSRCNRGSGLVFITTNLLLSIDLRF